MKLHPKPDPGGSLTFQDGTTYMVMPDGSLVRVTDRPNQIRKAAKKVVQ